MLTNVQDHYAASLVLHAHTVAILLYRTYTALIPVLYPLYNISFPKDPTCRNSQSFNSSSADEVSFKFASTSGTMWRLVVGCTSESHPCMGPSWLISLCNSLVPVLYRVYNIPFSQSPETPNLQVRLDIWHFMPSLACRSMYERIPSPLWGLHGLYL